MICNIGDSRVYRLTESGELRQCTLDDSVFGADWDVQRRLGEVVVATDLLEPSISRSATSSTASSAKGFTPPTRGPSRWTNTTCVLAVTDGVSDNLTFSELREVMRRQS